MRLGIRVWMATLALLLCIGLPSRRVGTTDSSTGQDARRKELLDTARQIMESAHYCALITVDQSGWPQARTIDPFLPESNMVVWFATNPKTRKVPQIQADSRVTLYYFDLGSLGYVTLLGTARLVDEKKEKERWWKKGWEAFYPDRDSSYLLVTVTPVRLEVVSTKRGISGDPITWEPPAVEFGIRK